MTQTRQDCEHGVEVLTVFAVFSNFDEVLDNFHSFDSVVLRADFRTDPKHLAVH